MTIATSSAEDSKHRNPMNNSVSTDRVPGGIFSSPRQKVGKLRTISAKMGESLFIVEYDGSVPLNVPADWPLPSYEVRRKLPMKECHICASDRYYMPGGHYRARNRRTSWVFRKKGEFFWLRVCFAHMKPEQRAVIKEMYSR